MDEYIERGNLEGAFDAATMNFLEKEDHLFDRKSVLAGMSVAAGIVHTVPAADVAPVVHGRWIDSSDRPDTIICSCCDRAFDVWKHESKDFFYCPNCGAKMDAEDRMGLIPIDINTTAELYYDYPYYILQYLRLRLGLDENDSSKDKMILQWPPKNVFSNVLMWNGLFGGCDNLIKGWIKDIYGVELDNLEGTK